MQEKQKKLAFVFSLIHDTITFRRIKLNSDEVLAVLNTCVVRVVSLDPDIVLIDSASSRLNKIQYNLIMHLFRIHLLDMIVCEYEHAAI
jgi:ABC-type phosphate transport system ATPase subunit